MLLPIHPSNKSMCGITGVVQLNDTPLESALLQAMADSLAHRGPDGEGYVLLAYDGHGMPIAANGQIGNHIRRVPTTYMVGLGHRRLAIIDRSPLAHQPMASEDDRIWITYNGEIYNYLELRNELQRIGYHFRSMSDTEVILQAYLQWGVACLEKLNGMFAFAIWDGHHERLFCARDRLGMKPFYYRLTGERFLFASEMKALLQDVTFVRVPNLRAVHDFLVLGLQDHCDETFFSGIQQLLPGHYLILERGKVEIRKWWDLEQAQQKSDLADRAAIQSFRTLFEDAVRLHLRSDVPVGSCLSGGSTLLRSSV